MELYKLKKIMNYFVFKHLIFGYRPIGQREIWNMVCLESKCFSSRFNEFLLAIYLTKRTLRNRQRHGLEEHEQVCVVCRRDLVNFNVLYVLACTG